jgi:hypothetical protein
MPKRRRPDLSNVRVPHSALERLPEVELLAREHREMLRGYPDNQVAALASRASCSTQLTHQPPATDYPWFRAKNVAAERQVFHRDSDRLVGSPALRLGSDPDIADSTAW